tara:strand:- start:617 stop:1174 length:558 start_codon:yes stop_codon:yes gene_type:complete
MVTGVETRPNVARKHHLLVVEAIVLHNKAAWIVSVDGKTSRTHVSLLGRIWGVILHPRQTKIFANVRHLPLLRPTAGHDLKWLTLGHVSRTVGPPLWTTTIVKKQLNKYQVTQKKWSKWPPQWVLGVRKDARSRTGLQQMMGNGFQVLLVIVAVVLFIAFAELFQFGVSASIVPMPMHSALTIFL